MDGIKITIESEKITKEFTKIKENLEKMASGYVVIKFNPKAQYQDGTKVENTAVILEYGKEGFNVSYPARPFWRSGIDAHLHLIKKRFDFNLKQVAQGRMTAKQAYEDIGKQVVAYIKKTIKNGTYAPLSEFTIKERERKGNTSTKPLIDTRLLINSIIYEVKGV